ncbi:MAG: hypothetical protein ABSC45_05980 [Desulfobaccales bacterium]|jgi:hypothetical protein
MAIFITEIPFRQENRRLSPAIICQPQAHGVLVLGFVNSVPLNQENENSEGIKVPL